MPQRTHYGLVHNLLNSARSGYPSIIVDFLKRV